MNPPSEASLFPPSSTVPHLPEMKEGVADRFYTLPDYYAIIRRPEPWMVQALHRMMIEHSIGPVSSVMDPACGPGNWLEPFAQLGLRVAGNDLSPSMYEYARDLFANHPSEITQGDARHLHFHTGPFDVAFEASGFTSLLPCDHSLELYFRGMMRHVRPGGLIILNAIVAEHRPPDTFPYTSWQTERLHGGEGIEIQATYDVMARDDKAGRETMRRTITQWIHGERQEDIVDTYPMRFFHVRQFVELAERCGLSFEGLYGERHDDWVPFEESQAENETLFVFRVPGAGCGCGGHHEQSNGHTNGNGHHHNANGNGHTNGHRNGNGHTNGNGRA